MSDEEGSKTRRAILSLLVVAIPLGVFGVISSRQLPPEMIASKQVAQLYVQAIREGKKAELEPLQAADFKPPSEDELRQIEGAKFLDMSDAVLGEKRRQACVGGGFGEGKVTTKTVRVYLRKEDAGWKVSRIQAFDNFDPATPPWPQNWGGGMQQGAGTCALGY